LSHYIEIRFMILQKGVFLVLVMLSYIQDLIGRVREYSE